MNLNWCFCSLNGVQKFDDILLFFHAEFLADGRFSYINSGACLLRNNTDFFGGELGAEQAAYLDFLVGQDSPEFLHQPGVEPIVQFVNNRIKVIPVQQAVYGNFVVADARYLF